MRAHMKSKHKINFCSILPVNPKHQNFDTDEFIATPNQRRSNSVANSVQFSPSKESSKVKQLSHCPIKYSFSPEEISQLPPMPVYRYEVLCSICQYATKVKMNLVRHMNLHKNNAEVAEIPTAAPVNPVPCLKNKELMFDKMKNLANSSHAIKMESKVEQLKDEVDLNIPIYIPLNKRYVCGANNCNYLCLEESMLRHHLQALHGHEQSYTCAHCNEDFSSEKYPINVDNILRHLRLHDNLLYKCSYCKFFNNLKNKVERHCSDKHADKASKVLTLREETDEVQVDSKEKKMKSWRCRMCKSRYSTKEAVIAHVENKHGIDSQYKCSYCNYKSLERDSFAEHFKSKHEGCNEDVIEVYFNEDAVKAPPVETQPQFDTTPLWVMNKQNNIKHIRGILLEEHEKIPKKGPIKIANKVEEVEKTPKKGPIKIATKVEEVEKISKKGSIKIATKVEEVEKISKKGSNKIATKVEEVEKISKKGPTKITTKVEEVEKTKKTSVKSSTKSTDGQVKKESISSNKSSSVDEENKNKIETKKITNLDLSIDAVARGSEISDDSDVDILHCPEDTYEFSEIEEKLGSLKTMPIEKLIASNFMGTYGPFGKPAFEAFLCPLCAIYQTPEMNDFKFHLYEELEYKLFGCKHCPYTECKKKKVEMHCKEVHGEYKSTDVIVLESQPQIEEWVKQVTTYQKRIIEFMNDDGEYLNVVDSDIEEPPASNTNDQIFKCKYCVYDTKTQSSLRTHEMRHWVQKPFGCNLCRFTGVVKAEMMKHGRKVHPGEKMTIISYEIENPTIVPITHKFVNKYPFKCTICNAMIEKDFEQHVEKMHPKIHKDTARKSTSKPYYQKEFTYYGTKPDINEDEIKKTVLHLNDKDNSTMTVEEYAKVIDIFPKVTLIDMDRRKT